MGGEIGFDMTLTNTIFTSISPLQGVKKIRANVKKESKGGIVASIYGGRKTVNNNSFGGVKSFLGGKGGFNSTLGGKGGIAAAFGG